MNPQRKLTVVPDTPKPPTTRQERELQRIATRKRRDKLGTYSDPAVRSPVLDMNESTRKGTRSVVLVDAPIPLFRRIWRWLKGVK